MRYLLLSVLFFCAAVLQTADLAHGAEKYALLIAVTKYQHAEMNRPALEFPENDASELAEIFKASGYKVELLLGKAATQEAIKQKLVSLKKQGDADGVAVLGLFGHGVEFEGTNEACFCPYDTGLREVTDSKGKKLFNKDGTPMIEPDPEGLVRMGDLLSALRLSPAGNRVLLADCCRNSPNRARGRAFGANLKLTDLPENTAALFACSANEQAFEHKDWGHGAFTKCLIDELRAQSATGLVTAGTLADRLRPKVKQLVASVSGGKDIQTTKSLVTDVVDLQLVSIKPPSSPSLLVAPFTATEARSAQEGWARSRGVAVSTRNSAGGEMVFIPPGEFDMGNEGSVDELMKLFPYAQKEWFKDAGKRHHVRITKPFLLGKHEVTIGQFRQFVMDQGYVTDAEKDDKGGWGYDSTEQKSVQAKKFNWKNTGFEPSQSDDHPVVNVSWNDAVAFCNWVSRKEGKREHYRTNGATVSVAGGSGYRLPSEAEWEYACRAGTTTRYEHGGDPEGLIKSCNTWDARAKTKFPKFGNFLNGDDGFAFTAPVGQFAANNFGLKDMHGNVLEWCEDWYGSDYYGSSPVADPSGPSSGSYRVIRGGCWNFSAARCRSAFRSRDSPAYRIFNLGFRLATVPSAE